MPPKEMSKKHQKIVQELQETKPEDFDKGYLKAQSNAHKEAIKLFEKEAKDDANPQLASFAKQQLPGSGGAYEHAQGIHAQGIAEETLQKKQ